MARNAYNVPAIADRTVDRKYNLLQTKRFVVYHLLREYYVGKSSDFTAT